MARLQGSVFQTSMCALESPGGLVQTQILRLSQGDFDFLGLRIFSSNKLSEDADVSGLR